MVLISFFSPQDQIEVLYKNNKKQDHRKVKQRVSLENNTSTEQHKHTTYEGNDKEGGSVGKIGSGKGVSVHGKLAKWMRVFLYKYFC